MRHEIGRQSLSDLSEWLTRVLGLGEGAVVFGRARLVLRQLPELERGDRRLASRERPRGHPGRGPTRWSERRATRLHGWRRGAQSPGRLRLQSPG